MGSKIVVNKFGGEILRNYKLVNLSIKRIKEQLEKNQKPIVVVSALGGITDKLVRLINLENSNLFSDIERQHKKWMENFKILNDKNLKEKFESLKEELKKDLKKIEKIKEKRSFER